jgi:molecular chaperone GrpE (heat shock protein)
MLRTLLIISLIDVAANFCLPFIAAKEPLAITAAMSAAVPASMLHIRARQSRTRPAVCCSADDAAPAEDMAPSEDMVAAASEDQQEAKQETPEDKKKSEKKELRDKINALEKQMPKARGDLAAAQDSVKDAGENGYMLLAANFERFRQQARGELKAQQGYGRVAAVRELLPFIETFEALQAEGEAEAENPIHKFYGGIYKQAQQLMGEWGVKPYVAVAGEAFDVRRHESLERIVTEDVPAGQIIEALEGGWEMGTDEILRLAKCTVSSGPPVPPKEEQEEEPTVDEATEEAQ